MTQVLNLSDYPPAAAAAVFNLAGMADVGGTFAICRVATRASS
jgi:hypothetical protein